MIYHLTEIYSFMSVKVLAAWNSFENQLYLSVNSDPVETLHSR